MSTEFLLGVVFTASMVIGIYFLKFWRRTGDLLFLAFAAAFLVEGLNRLRFLRIQDPGDADPSIYVVRLCAFLLVLTAIVWKNRKPNS